MITDVSCRRGGADTVQTVLGTVPMMCRSRISIDLSPSVADTDLVWLLWALVVVVVVFLMFGPMFDAPRRGGNGWTWIVAGPLLGPLAGVAYYTSRRGVRLAARRNGELGPRGVTW